MWFERRFGYRSLEVMICYLINFSSPSVQLFWDCFKALSHKCQKFFPKKTHFLKVGKLDAGCNLNPPVFIQSVKLAEYKWTGLVDQKLVFFGIIAPYIRNQKCWKWPTHHAGAQRCPQNSISIPAMTLMLFVMPLRALVIWRHGYSLTCVHCRNRQGGSSWYSIEADLCPTHADRSGLLERLWKGESVIIFTLIYRRYSGGSSLGNSCQRLKCLFPTIQIYSTPDAGSIAALYFVYLLLPKMHNAELIAHAPCMPVLFLAADLGACGFSEDALFKSNPWKFQTCPRWSSQGGVLICSIWTRSWRVSCRETFRNWFSPPWMGQLYFLPTFFGGP